LKGTLTWKTGSHWLKGCGGIIWEGLELTCPEVDQVSRGGDGSRHDENGEFERK
jgi:hypothetical protein